MRVCLHIHVYIYIYVYTRNYEYYTFHSITKRNGTKEIHSAALDIRKELFLGDNFCAWDMRFVLRFVMRFVLRFL